MSDSAVFFNNLLDKAVYAGGRDLMFNISLNKPTFGLYVKDSKNHLNFLSMEDPFKFKKHLKKIIELHSRPNERSLYVDSKGEYNFDRMIFNMRFSTPEVQKLFGHGFNLTLTVQDRGRLITGAFTVKHTEEEWAFYEKFCSEHKSKVEEQLKNGELVLQDSDSQPHKL